MAYAEDNPDGKPRLAAFAQGLQVLGWTDGRNIRIEYRWSAGDADALANTPQNWSHSHRMLFWPNISTVGPLQQATRRADRIRRCC